MGGIGERIMVSALTGVMSPLLGKLANHIGEEYAKFKGVRKKLESLTKELITINVMLEKYAAMEKPDMQVKAWMKEVRELAYDIEDRIDLFTYHVDHEQANKTNGFKRILGNTLRKVKKLHHRHKFADEIQELQTLVNEAYERQLRYKLDTSTSSTMHTEIDPRLPALYVEVEKLVGIDDPSEEIINRLVGQERRVVSIAGPGGSGKTTLANQVYEKMKGQFIYTAFVSVSQRPNINNILRELLWGIESSGGGSDRVQLARSDSDKQLIDRLRAYLENKEYLIVIDDLWSDSAWKAIQCALPQTACASRIITTTRIISVAKSCCTTDKDFVYQIKPLSRSDSENLFLKRLQFGAETKCPAHLEQIMDQILHKCDGLPLAIIAIASLLAGKPRTEEEWERVRNSIGSTHEKDKELEVIEKILSLSYYDLSHNLKTCFLYLSIFPEDAKIDRDCLVWRWIGEGFIVAKRGYTLKEVGESYFNELINRSLIQPVLMEYGGMVNTCRVHDIVLDFIISRSFEENFVSIFDGNDLSTLCGKVRRLTFSRGAYFCENSYDLEKALRQGTMSLSHLRSLHLFGVSFNWMQSSLDLKVLRVLDIGNNPHLKNGDLKFIGSLCQLRYLNVGTADNLNKLPVQIGMLQFLQTLDLSGTYIDELPETIIQLKQLMRLLGSSIRKLPDGFGGMQALEELSGICLHESNINFLQELQNLIKLRVLQVALTPYFESPADEESYEKSVAISLCKLGQYSLRSLHICVLSYGCHIDVLIDSWRPAPRLLEKLVIEGVSLYRIPTWINSSLSNLTYLNIRVRQVQEEDVRMLKDLQALLVLRLSLERGSEQALIMSCGGFQCLVELSFTDDYGPGLMFESGAMPKLQVLELALDVHVARHVYGGYGFGIRHLSSLKYIRISYSSYPPLQDLESGINDEVNLLPNRPKVEIKSGPNPDWGVQHANWG